MATPICPICATPLRGENPTKSPDFPFCSQRCRTIDLGRWLDQRYSVPADDAEETADEAERESP